MVSENINNLMVLLKERRSVRIFSGKKIASLEINRIIEAGIWAPSGCNNQELRVVILKKEEDVQEFLKFKPFLKGVSHVVLVLCDMSLPFSKKLYKDIADSKLCFIDTGLALANMILYAKSKDIDSCIVNLSPFHLKYKNISEMEKNIFFSIKCKLENKIYRFFRVNNKRSDSFETYLRKSLQIPQHLEIMCGVAFGYGKVIPNVHKERHGPNPVMRQGFSYYVYKKKE